MNSTAQEDIVAAQSILQEVREAVNETFIGDPRVVEQLLIAMLAQGHILLEGVPGVAKTTLVRAFSTAIGCAVRRIQFTPDLLPSDITGTYVLNPQQGEFSFRAGPLFAQVVLADEINRAPAKTQSALLEAMQEAQVTVEGESFELPKPFLVLATQNPLDLEGTYPLPEAQVDRFLLRVQVGYPERRDEVQMLRAHGAGAPATRAVLNASTVEGLQRITTNVHIEDDLLDYIVGLTAFTRQHPRLRMGASPRASLALVQAAKGRAVVSGRNFVAPDDIQAMAPAVLVHRLSVADDSLDEPQAAASVVNSALREVSYRRSVRPA